MAYAYSATKTDTAMGHAASSTWKTNLNAAIDTLGADLDTEYSAARITEAEANDIDQMLTDFAQFCADQGQ